MPLPNPFRRQSDRPSLRERAADLRANLGRPAPEPKHLPAPGSDEAMAAYRAAYREETTRSQAVMEGYPDLRRASSEWWTADTLSKAMEAGEITPAECARLYPRATERELRLAQIAHELNLGALHAAAFAGDYSAAGTAPESAPVFGPMAEATKAAAADALSGFGISTPLRRAIVAHERATVAMLTEPDESNETTDRMSAAVERTGEAIRAVPAVSLADVRAKLTMLLPEILPDVNGSAPTAFLENIRADVNQLTAQTAEVMSPHLLTSAILDLWSVWTVDSGEGEGENEAFERLEDHRSTLIDAADTLPLSREAIMPKALALAWIMYGALWRPSRPRDRYTTDGRLALDIHAVAKGLQHSVSRPTAPAAPKVTVVVTVDFAAAPIGTLGLIAHTMGHLAAVAHALSSSSDGCAPLSYLLTSLAEEFDAVQDGAEAELQRRQPTGLEERRAQLAAVADRIIWNGDESETAVFIQDLAAWAADQARR